MTARKPDHLERLAGTARPDRAARETTNLPAVNGVPRPPSWLTDADGLKEWRRLGPTLTACKLLNAGNVELFAHFCALHGRLVATWAAGETPTAALISAYRALSRELGLLGVPVFMAKVTNRFSRNARFAKRARPPRDRQS